MTREREPWDAAFHRRLSTAMAADLRLLTHGLADDDVVGDGVYTDADASNIVVTVQTRQHLEGLIKRRPRYRNHFRWSMGEWDLLSFEALEFDALESINDELAAASDGPKLWEAIVDALAGVVRDGHLSRFRDAVTNPSQIRMSGGGWRVERWQSTRVTHSRGKSTL